MIDGTFTLPRDVQLEPIESLPGTALAGLTHKPGDFALTRPQSRSHTHVVNESTAKLLQLFREPLTIVDAVVAFSREEDTDPTVTLDEAFPVLRTLIEAGMLLPAGSRLAAPIDFLLERGERVGDLVVQQPVAVVIDTEVYLALTANRDWAAVKIARPGAEDRLEAVLRNEATILELLDGTCSPRLVARGHHADRPFIALEWCRGVDPLAAAEAVRDGDASDRCALQAIVLAVVDVYALLHEQGVLHGDVHPRNLLLDASGRARIIDFGQARRVGGHASDGPTGRGGVDLYMEPELARARQEGRATPATAVGEQYSIAALVYFLLTGTHTHDFVLEKAAMLQQVSHDPPATFTARDVQGFDHVERALRRALAKLPEQRFPSVRAFAESLHHAFSLDEAAAAPRARHATSACTSLFEQFLSRTALGGTLMEEGLPAPSASVNFGSAGLALAMLRIAQQREDASLLAIADVFSHAALRDQRDSGEGAFRAPDLEMSQEVVGHASLYHASPGVFCVAALVADAQADEERRRWALERFSESCALEEPRAELVFGLAGLLVGCGVLLDALAPTPGGEEAMLLPVGHDVSRKLLDQLRRMPDLEADAPDSITLGVAHGHSGVLYSLLQWAQVTKTAVPDEVTRRLEQLTRLAQPEGRGLAWPVATRRRSPDGMRATWCNGAAGHLHLWLLAHQLLGDPEYLHLAEGAAWTVHESPGTGGDLCCGAAGRAYGLLRFFRHTGDQVWLDRAHALAEQAARVIAKRHLRANSLYRGEVGVCLLIADLENPRGARMPLFELS